MRIVFNVSLLLCILFIRTSVLYAQETYNYSLYTQENGLASSSIKQILKDRNEFIWIVSENGLNRFDGYNFKTYNLSLGKENSFIPSEIEFIYDYEAGKLLVQTTKEILIYDYENLEAKRIYTFNTNTQKNYLLLQNDDVFFCEANYFVQINLKTGNKLRLALPEAFSPQRFRIFFHENSKIWINDNSFIYYYNLTTKKLIACSTKYNDGRTINTNQNLLRFFTDKNLNVNYYNKKGFFKFDSKSNCFVQVFSSKYSSYNNFKSKTQLYFGNYYVIELNNQLLIVDVEKKTERLIALNSPNHTLNNLNINHINKCNDSCIWVSTVNNGIIKFNAKLSSFTHHIPKIEGIDYSLSKNISIVYQVNNVLWLSAPGLGLIKAEDIRPMFKKFGNKFAPNFVSYKDYNNVRSIQELDSLNLLVGTLDGLLTTNKKSNISDYYYFKSNESLLPTTPISKIIKDSNENFWIATWSTDGIYMLNNKTKKVHHIQPSRTSEYVEYSSIRTIFIDSRNYLWIGTDANIIYRSTRSITSDIEKIQFESLSSIVKTKNNYSFGICFSIVENLNGEIFIGSQNGFYIYNYNANSIKGFFHNSNDTNSISDNNVRSILVEKSGDVWIGTFKGGLNLFNYKTQKFKSFDTNHGLPDNSIYSIIDDNGNCLYLGTNKGIAQFSKSTFSSRNFTPKDGLQNFEFNTNAVCKLSSNEIALGGIKGFNIINPSIETNKINDSKLVLTQIELSGKEIISKKNVFTFSSKQNNISFQFAVLNYYRNSENKYAYMLSGIESEWTLCGDRRFTNYANLAPGTYTFRVKASNYLGVWSKNEIAFTFQILKPWYNTWWFYTLLILSVSAIVYFFYYNRLKQALKLEIMRNAIARDLHDEIGSNLSSINLFNEVAKEKSKNQNDQIAPLLNKIGEYAQISQDAMSDIVWMINARNDNFENIIVKMRTIAIELIESQNIDLNLNFDNSLNQLKLKMNERKNFYLIYKEAINNIVKYSQCQKVEINLYTEKNNVVLIVKDDGIGFDTSKSSNGNGIYNMTKRAIELNGKLHVESQIGIGTKMSLMFPL